MATFFIGTTNSAKIAEIQVMLSGSPHTFLFPKDFDLTLPDPEESGQTFAENAVIKARAYARATKLPTISEDSGLTVISLNGFPGVQSNRWLSGNDTDRNQSLLEKLTGFSDREATFVNVLALVSPKSSQIHYFSGELNGSISLRPSGTAGFGYDPIFIPTGQSLTVAELGQDWKNAHSARFISWSKIKAYLDSLEEAPII